MAGGGGGEEREGVGEGQGWRRGRRGPRSSIRSTVQSATQKLPSMTVTKSSTFTMYCPVQHPKSVCVHRFDVVYFVTLHCVTIDHVTYAC